MKDKWVGASGLVLNEPLIFEKGAKGRKAYSLPELDVDRVLPEKVWPREFIRKELEGFPEMSEVDVAIVLGANDVVNPDAKNNPTSPIAGMPIINVDQARTVVVIKRSLSPGFANIPNPLFALDNCLMYFADGKKAVLDLVAAVKQL